MFFALTLNLFAVESETVRHGAPKSALGAILCICLNIYKCKYQHLRIRFLF